MADCVSHLNSLLQNIAKRINVHYCACTFFTTHSLFNIPQYISQYIAKDYIVAMYVFVNIVQAYPIARVVVQGLCRQGPHS